jgi:UDP-N-acetylmuramyl pentapeptide phosphotransferase/UDP-N-acetylglucosamine-1-phosphate transferase
VTLALVLAFAASLLTAVVLVVTQRLHGRFTLDGVAGVQKLHKAPTPRVGGLALAAGWIAGGLALPPESAALWGLIGAAAALAFAAGLAEDLTKRVGVGLRLLATVAAGLLFCLATGLHVARADIPGLDWALGHAPFAVLFTAVAIGGVANAVNIIDGVNGLASGTAIIILSGFAILAREAGDPAMLQLCLVAIAALLGFFLLNFPAGRIFLGDAGAYAAGFVLAVVAVVLPLRNPELSPLVALLALAYPVTETLVSIQRRVAREGTHPGRPDRLHLHSLVYRSRARRLAQRLGHPQLRNALTSVILWSLSLLSVVLMVLARDNSALILLSLALVGMAYILMYRRVALLPRRFPLPVLQT